MRVTALRAAVVAALAAGVAIPGPRDLRSASAGPRESAAGAWATAGDAAPVCDPRAVGVPSCASASCHGSDVPADGRSRTSYRVWLDDPHADAHRVLYGAESRRIWAAYRSRLTGPTAESAWQAKECLACHAGPASEPAGFAFGVGCEACHGPARDWLTAHHTAEWNNPSIWPAERKRVAGFADTKGLAERARACAECHVGSPDREVNHDLIAAGHPRLFFEFSAFLARYPKHWDEAEDRARHVPEAVGAMGSTFEAKAWLVGQIVAAENAGALLADRAADDSAPWPEFAEYGCYACHHALDESSWRRSPDRGRPGDLPWGTWHFALVDELPDVPEDVSREVGRLRELMARPLPDRNEVRASASRLRLALADWSERVGTSDVTPDEIRRLVSEFYARPERVRAIAARDWDAAAQLYLAAASLSIARREGTAAPVDAEAVKDALSSAQDALRFRPRFDRTTAVDSPADYDRKNLDRLAESLGRAAALLNRDAKEPTP